MASGNDVALAAAFDGYKTAVAYVGDIDALVPVIGELEPMLRRQHDLLRLPWVSFESAFPALAAGDWPTALARIEDSLVIARQIGSMAHASWHLATVGGIARLQGRLDDALAIGREALAASAPHAWAPPVAAAELGITLLEAGARDEAIALLERTLSAVGKDGAESSRLRCLAPRPTQRTRPGNEKAWSNPLRRSPSPCHRSADHVLYCNGPTFSRTARIFRNTGRPRSALRS